MERRKLDVLILEDVDLDLARTCAALSTGGFDPVVRRATSRATFEAELRGAAPDIVLLDFNLPEFNGVTALQLSRERWPATPVVIVTGALPDELAVALLRQGAVDYVIKDRLARLGSAVRNAIEAVQSETERREAEERYQSLFAQALDGMVLLDAAGAVVDCNPEFERQCGRTADSLRGLSLSLILRMDEAPPAGAAKLPTDSDAEPAHSRAVLRRTDGTQVPVEWRTKAVVLHGKPHVLAMSRDLSRSLIVEEQLLDQLDELRRFQRVTADRELRMEELEDELRRLRSIVPA